ncbi:IS91 family transposase [Salinisphaera sp. G21_0]|uniref:IS91 family transposase n=1 Tax=Salinisphaera sp. G21_0 TaxID=2821094 RepID=UPI001ADA55F9|nr:IS91 family transposase [Salinisphaera sp. G21_0]MBO9484731.1 IS91 family transposase [Salinisphaera sp. G21_0]
MKTSVQGIFAENFEDYSKNKKLPLHHYKAANDFIRCRTSALGGHVQACPDGHVSNVWYNSCRHRNCPQCDKIQVEKWLTAKNEILIDASHRHLVFTLPHQLNELWLLNSSLMTDLLFKAVSQTLKELLSDKKYLGADTGFLLNLHTWGRNLSLHPHIHCLITDGGVNAQGEWVHPVKKCFLPFRVVMRIFRGKFCAELKAASEQLRMPDRESPTTINNLANQIGRKDWHVEVMDRYEHGQGVINYLARYVRGGPVKNSQINEQNNKISLSYQSHQTGKRETQNYSKPGFIKQLLIHVPDKGKRTVRFYGLYTSGKRKILNRARELHKQPPVSTDRAVLDWQSYLRKIGQSGKAQCPTCKKPLVVKERFKKGHDPTRNGGALC